MQVSLIMFARLVFKDKSKQSCSSLEFFVTDKYIIIFIHVLFTIPKLYHHLRSWGYCLKRTKTYIEKLSLSALKELISENLCF